MRSSRTARSPLATRALRTSATIGAMPALYRRPLGHVMKSTYEGFGMTLLEAMPCGAPVLTENASCVPEVASDGALLLPP